MKTHHCVELGSEIVIGYNKPIHVNYIVTIKE
jgi:hypothetical protein